MTGPSATPPKDPRNFLPLHPTEFRILMALEKRASHGYQIVQMIESQEELPQKLYPGNLYRRIRNLHTRGLIEDAPSRPDSDADPRRRYFRITELGRAVARWEALRLRRLADEAARAGLLPDLR